MRVAVDAVMLKLPKDIYERSGLRRLIVPSLDSAGHEPIRAGLLSGARRGLEGGVSRLPDVA
jgi:hypothetical protein